MLIIWEVGIVSGIILFKNVSVILFIVFLLWYILVVKIDFVRF